MNLPLWAQAALAYAAEGLLTFPVHTFDTHGRCTCGDHGGKYCSPGKHPRTRNGLTGATLDPDRIRAWAVEYPEANVGVVVPDGKAVIDVDVRNDGYATLEQLEQQHGRLPVTRAAYSGSDPQGKHLWLDVPPGYRLPDKLGRGVDVRQGGTQYVVVPPSLHASGRRYEWIGDWRAPIERAPEWLVARMQPARQPGQVTARTDIAQSRAWDDQQCLTIAMTLAHGWTDGQKHTMAKALAGWVQQNGGGYLDALQIVELLWCNVQAGNNWQGAVDAVAWSFERPELAHGYRDLAALCGKEPVDRAFEHTSLGVNMRLVKEWSENTEQATQSAVGVSSTAAATPQQGGFLRRVVVPEGDDDETEDYRRLLPGRIDLARGCTTAVQAQPRGGKTPFMLQIALCLANELPVFGEQTGQDALRVVFVTWEKSAATKARLRSLARKLGVSPNSIGLFAASAPLDLEHAAILAAECLKINVDLLVIDTLNSAMGVQDQNEMGAAAPLKALSQALPDAAVLVSVYERKSSTGQLGDVAGSAALAGAFDACIRLAPVTKTRYIVESTRELVKEPATFEIEALGDERSLGFEVVDVLSGSTQRSDGDVDKRSKEQRLHDLSLQITALFEGRPHDTLDLESIVEVTHDTVIDIKRACKLLTECGKLTEDNHGKALGWRMAMDHERHRVRIRGRLTYQPPIEVERYASAWVQLLTPLLQARPLSVSELAAIDGDNPDELRAKLVNVVGVETPHGTLRTVRYSRGMLYRIEPLRETQ